MPGRFDYPLNCTAEAQAAHPALIWVKAFPLNRHNVDGTLGLLMGKNSERHCRMCDGIAGPIGTDRRRHRRILLRVRRGALVDELELHPGAHLMTYITF